MTFLTETAPHSSSLLERIAAALPGITEIAETGFVLGTALGMLALINAIL